MLLGAIFPEDKDYYECAIKKLHEKVQVVSQIYARRGALLEHEINSGICQAAYSDAIGEFQELRKISAGEYSMTPDDVNSHEVLRFGDVKANLQQLNEKVELHSCPLIY
jgi:type I restriction-modification system DNA methylase subunit